ncbi:MAG: hypothetical protein Q4D19_07550 [Lautropia sp.]|nr:hypothetical protein [Lautropia sp.]
MSDMQAKNARKPLGYLLLRDDHVVPVHGLSPEQIKFSANSVVWKEDKPQVRHNALLTAIVKEFGFCGDFGDYKNTQWPDLQRFLAENGCTDQINIFAVSGCIDLAFGIGSGPKRRDLADRVFHGDKDRLPERIFLPYGTDWSVFDRRPLWGVPEQAIPFLSCEKAEAEKILSDLFGDRYNRGGCRQFLFGQYGFLDDKLVDLKNPVFVDKTHLEKGGDEHAKRLQRERFETAVRAFRRLQQCLLRSWVDLIPYNNNIIILRAHDGRWDLVWRDLRESLPPDFSEVCKRERASIEDCPSYVEESFQRERRRYFKRAFWDEKEAHEAEQFYYDQGGLHQDRPPVSDADLRFSWNMKTGSASSDFSREKRGEDGFPGFKNVSLLERSVCISSLVTIADFRGFAEETGYFSRRGGDPRNDWFLANSEDDPGSPVAATWGDVLAYCAWFERKHGVQVRLPRRKDLIEIRPVVHEFDVMYPDVRKVNGVFQFPPGYLPSIDREKVGVSVDISGEQGEIRTARWRDKINWKRYHGLDFIDALDTVEWCRETCIVLGRYWQGNLPHDSWGEYKGMKACFRLVIDS